ncbi:MAG TPA: MBL fold metallo-hydrolase [Stellaceae bacterium]|nr:MBL fold metallo-hydrolase [Stellaceae bacterium]
MRRFFPGGGWLGALVGLLGLLASPPTLAAGCQATVAGTAPALLPAAFRPAAGGEVALTFLGHASFLIESPGGISIVTDYNGVNRPAFLPDIVTMNHAHATHYTDFVDPGIRHVLRGWDTGEGIPHYDLTEGDVHIRNVPTNIRDGTGTEFGGNSIFVFETADLCIAHLSHLHHTLTSEHLAALGAIDVLLAPVDGAYTLSHADMIEVIDQIKPPLVVPMHYFAPSVLQHFLARSGGRYPVHVNTSARVMLSRASLPKTTEILVLSGD